LKIYNVIHSFLGMSQVRYREGKGKIEGVDDTFKLNVNVKYLCFITKCSHFIIIFILQSQN